MAGDVVSEFREFCRVDLQLSKRKVKDHCWQVKRFLDTMGRDPAAISRSEVRSYLTLFLDKAPATYAGVLKSLKVFFRDYLKRGSVVSTFKFPDIPLSVIEIPPKKDVQQFYYALKTGKARSVYLMYATSGLRKGELLPLLLKDINLDSRMIVPAKRQWTTKNTWVTFYNQEAAKELTEYLSARKDSKPKLFPFGKAAYHQLWKEAERPSP